MFRGFIGAVAYAMPIQVVNEAMAELFTRLLFVAQSSSKILPVYRDCSTWLESDQRKWGQFEAFIVIFAEQVV